MTHDWDTPTTKRFPRSIAEAFPQSMERAAVLEIGPRPWWWRVFNFFRSIL